MLDPPDLDNLHGSLDSSDLRHSGNVDGSQPPPVNSSDPNTPSGDIEDLWMQETIHLTDLRTSVGFIQAL
jgi:hypothetical protein